MALKGVFFSIDCTKKAVCVPVRRIEPEHTGQSAQNHACAEANHVYPPLKKALTP